MAFETDGRLAIQRRHLLKTVGAAGGLGLLASGARGAEHEGFVLVQGETCVPVEPLSGSATVESFYDYATYETEYSSAGTVDLQRPDTSILFLYDGPEGLSLVVVHNELDGDGDGGSASFDITGLPEDGEWVVQDDFYTGPSNYDVWNVDGSRSEIDWTWAAGRTDGGAYRSVGDATSIQIDPAFNEDAALYGEYYEGTVTDWQLLSGSLEDPDRISLDMDRAVTIAPGNCAGRRPAGQGSADVEAVEFKGCGEVWFVFEEAFEDPVEVAVETTAGWQPVTLEAEDLQRVPGQFGESPLVKWPVRGDGKILAVETAAMGTVENPHQCARAGRRGGEADDDRGSGPEAADEDRSRGGRGREDAEADDDAADEDEPSGDRGPPEDAGGGRGPGDDDEDEDGGDGDDEEDGDDESDDDDDDGRSRGRGRGR